MEGSARLIGSPEKKPSPRNNAEIGTCFAETIFGALFFFQKSCIMTTVLRCIKNAYGIRNGDHY
ncbi:MAG: hypothetical protein A3I44_05700 [Candidatus Sungbacteria bacterium RIFCSPLOWO2_02_FULL_51_17]|nr:MAG: hypothetical protein A2676_03690 [Candidatus Sungbacteria bacterium RIFCSPHIGHO2_01_FULL_51_22]OHA11744.1 MAG: hypothetical protein A3I44_05700 [Candidatus Sungbacteria bacterium RIFCSPLOWO2_02_FULL_51_17]